MKPYALLINLPPAMDHHYNTAGSIYPATGLLVTGTIFKHQGLRVKLIDGAVTKDYIYKVLAELEQQPALICFSVMTSQVPLALMLAELIKQKNSNIPIIWGGIHTILFPKQTIENPNVDIVVVGDGVETAIQLSNYFNGKGQLSNVQGIVFKNPATKELIFTPAAAEDDIEKIPHIDFEILEDVETYLGAQSVYAREIKTDQGEKVRLMPILTGLGCCFRCQFCINSFLKRKYRFRSARSIIDEIKRLQQKYQANAFIFLDEDFPISKRRLHEFLDLIEQEQLKFYWRIWGRVSYFNDNYINQAMLKRLERNGLRSMAMGAESGSQKILDIIKKQITVDQIINSAQQLKTTKITPRYSFIVGLEGEAKEDTLATYQLCVKLKELNFRVDIAGPFFFRYYPGSPIFDRIKQKYKLNLPEKLENWKQNLSPEGFLMIKKMPWLWPGFERKNKILKDYLELFIWLRGSRNVLAQLLKAIIKWRSQAGFFPLPFEVIFFRWYQKIKCWED